MCITTSKCVQFCQLCSQNKCTIYIYYTRNTLGTEVPIMLSYPCLSPSIYFLCIPDTTSASYTQALSFSEIPGTCLLSNKVFVWIIYSYELTYIHQSEFRVSYWMQTIKQGPTEYWHFITIICQNIYFKVLLKNELYWYYHISNNIVSLSLIHVQTQYT